MRLRSKLHFAYAIPKNNLLYFELYSILVCPAHSLYNRMIILPLSSFQGTSCQPFNRLFIDYITIFYVCQAFVLLCLCLLVDDLYIITFSREVCKQLIPAFSCFTRFYFLFSFFFDFYRLFVKKLTKRRSG